MTVDIYFFTKDGNKIACCNMCGSNFESKILVECDFNGHSDEAFWDYDKYGLVQDSVPVKQVWDAFVKYNYISSDHSLLGLWVTKFEVQ